MFDLHGQLWSDNYLRPIAEVAKPVNSCFAEEGKSDHFNGTRNCLRNIFEMNRIQQYQALILILQN